jgi:leucyl aminopeptidase
MGRPPLATTADVSVIDVASPVLLVGAFAKSGAFTLQDEAHAIDAALGGHLEALDGTGFKAALGEVSEVPTLGRVPAQRVVVVGLGSRDTAGTKELRRAAASAARQLGEYHEIACALHLAFDDADAAARAATEGLLLGTYRYTDMKSDPHPSKIERLILIGAKDEPVDRGVAVGEATFLARDLINEPASSLTPIALARRAQEMADVSGLGCEVFDETALEEMGCGGILGVSQGSQQPPRLIKLSYSPTGANGKVVLVGKGVTYDSGGYSLKPAASMEQMKTDMAGGAVVIAAMSILRRLDVTVDVLGLIPATENLVSGSSIKPGDVLRQHGGKTVEVNNTDAEGRLVLADAFGVAGEEGADAILDIATLTGAIHIALGSRVTGMFSNDDTVAAEVLEASERAGEDMWRLPLVDAYKKELDSSIADMKNSGSRYGSAITAAIFLKEFVPPDTPWVHLDIAGTGRADSDYDDKSRGGTAVGVRTILAWLEGRSR